MMTIEEKLTQVGTNDNQIHTNDLEAKGELTALLQYANGVTGEQDSRLGDAIYRLAQGYGQGGGSSAWELLTTLTVDNDSTSSVSAEFDPMEELMVIAICSQVNTAQAHYYSTIKGSTSNRPSIAFTQNVPNQTSIFYSNKFGGYAGRAGTNNAIVAHTRNVAAGNMQYYGTKLTYIGIEAQTWTNNQKLWQGTSFYIYGKR